MIIKDILNEIYIVKKNSNKIIGCFPLYPPIELFHSMGITPIMLWGLRDHVTKLDKSDHYIQNYACSVSRHMTQFILSESGQYLDGLFMYNGCDTLRNLPEILTLGLEKCGISIPFFKIHIPMSLPYTCFTENYLKNEINNLINELSKKYDILFCPDNFINSIELYNQINILSQKLETAVAEGFLPFSKYCEILLKTFFIPAEDQKNILNDALKSFELNNHKDECIPKKRIILSGILPPPKKIADAIESAGMLIVANDIACFKRFYYKKPDAMKNPSDYYVKYYKEHYPCPTLLNTADNRLKSLQELIEKNNANGIIFFGEKFCEYEYFEFPFLEKQFKGLGIKTILLEIAADDDLNIEAFRTRIEAFSDLL